MHTEFWLESLKGRDYLEDNIKMNLKERGCGLDSSGSG
jgi:hypothetical protein